MAGSMPFFNPQITHKQRMHTLLSKYYGYSSFREPQEEVILNALAGNDSLVVMATGAGKSICYQIPPLITGRPCIVVSPLIALMEDQVAALTARGINAAFLGSAQTSTEVTRRAWQGDYQLIYITPELATGNTSQLQQLHSTHGIGLIAIDEAHCVSEWGHDFRPSYRQLGTLRTALPGVPIMAVTATATDRCRQDILDQLQMGKPGQPPLRQWVMSFQRANLHLSVVVKAGTSLVHNFASLVREVQEAEAQGRELDPTLIYAQTTNQVDDIAAYLQSKGIKAVKYHASLPICERKESQRAFQHDEAAVMVASLAFGMGIDKPNIRRIIHYGIPSSLEAYYQQAGRAGRDGVPSQCTLVWAAQDFMVQDLIKNASNLTGWTAESHARGMASLRAYVNGSDCRHAALVNFFQPGKMPAHGPCVGGCDNCTRRKEAAAASGAHLAEGMRAGETDVTEPARLLIATVKALGSFGLNKSVAILRGSKAKGIEPWMMEKKAADGTPLHGAGSNRSDNWWKGFGNVLMGQGFLMSQSKRNQFSGMSYSIVQVTSKGHDLLAGRPARLCLMLPAYLDAEESKRRQKEEAERQRAEAREAAQKARDEQNDEKQQLLAKLKRARKAVATTLGQAPDVLVNDFTLSQLVELRPADREQLQFVSGFGQAALQHFAQPLLSVIQQFCSSSKHLKHGTEGQWNVLRRHRAAQQQLQSQHTQQQSTQLRNAGSAGLVGFAFLPPTQGSGCSATAHGRHSSQGNSPGPHYFDFAADAQQHMQQTTQAFTACTVGAAAEGLRADMQSYQSLLDCNVLNEPKVAATTAWDKWEAGQTAEQVATLREKPIQVATVLGYLAEAAAFEGSTPGGCAVEKLQRLQDESGLTGEPGRALTWRIAAAIQSQKAAGLSAVKRALGEDASYGQIKVVAAMMALQLLPAPAQFEEQELVQQPTQHVQRSAAVDKVLGLPSSSAQKLYAMWQLGVPLAVLGSMEGLSMQLQSVLGELACMAAAGYPSDMQQLVAAAQLHEDAAHRIAAAINSQGQTGIYAVKQQLWDHIGYGQIKVVAALIALQQMWFAEGAAAAAAYGGGSINAAPDLQAQHGAVTGAAAVGTGGAPMVGADVFSESARLPRPQPPQQQQQQQQQQGCRSTSPGLSPDGNTLPASGPAAVEAAGNHAADTTTDNPEAEDKHAGAAATDGNGSNIDAAAVAPAAAAPLVKRARPAFCLSNKTGKRRKPTSIAPPKPVAAAAAANGAPGTGSPQLQSTTPPVAGMAGTSTLPGSQQQDQEQQQERKHCAVVHISTQTEPAANGAAPSTSQQQQQREAVAAVVSPAPQSAAAAVHATPAAAVIITQQTVLQALWGGASTAPELLKQLGVSGRDQEQQLQRVLEELVNDGEQVCVTPEGRGVDVHDHCVRFIAF